MLITDPWFYALAIPAFLLTGISKGGFASGAGNTGVLMMSLVMPASQAAGIALLTSPVLLPLAPIGIRLGVWLQGRMSDRVFYRIIYVLLAVTGVELVFEGLFR